MYSLSFSGFYIFHIHESTGVLLGPYGCAVKQQQQQKQAGTPTSEWRVKISVTGTQADPKWTRRCLKWNLWSHKCVPILFLVAQMGQRGFHLPEMCSRAVLQYSSHCWKQLPNFYCLTSGIEWGAIVELTGNEKTTKIASKIKKLNALHVYVSKFNLFLCGLVFTFLTNLLPPLKKESSLQNMSQKDWSLINIYTFTWDHAGWFWPTFLTIFFLYHLPTLSFALINYR